MEIVRDKPFGIEMQDLDTGLSPFEGAFSLAVHESPTIMTDAFLDRQRLNGSGTGHLMGPEELNNTYPSMSKPFTEDTNSEVAAFAYDRDKTKKAFETAMALAPKNLYGTMQTLAGSLVGALIDPIGNTLGLGAGFALRALGASAKIMGVSKATMAVMTAEQIGAMPIARRVALGYADNFLGNAAVDVMSKPLADSMNEEFDVQERITSNLLASFGFAVMAEGATSAMRGTLKKDVMDIFRPNKSLGKKVVEATMKRVESDLAPGPALEVFNKQIAAERSGTHFNYEHMAHGPETKYFSGSNRYVENFSDAEHTNLADLGPGTYLTSNPNEAHASSLSAEAGNLGSVFEHDVSSLKLIDGNAPASSLPILEGYLNDLELADSNLTIAQALESIAKAEELDKVDVGSVKSIEQSSGMDGVHFEQKDYRGQTKNPSNIIKLFDSEKPVVPKSMVEADPKAIGKVEPGSFDKNAEDLKREIFDGPEYTPIGEQNPPEYVESSAKTEVDNSIAENLKKIKDIDQFEGHVTPAEKLAFERLETDIKLAAKKADLMRKALGCVR